MNYYFDELYPDEFNEETYPEDNYEDLSDWN